MPTLKCDELVVTPTGVAIGAKDCPLEDEGHLCMWKTAGGWAAIQHVCPWFRVLTGKTINCAKED